MNEISITVHGNLVADPDYKITPSGVSLARVRIASTTRVYDTTVNDWRDRDTSFFTVSCWRALAEHVRDSVAKGDPVVVTGRLVPREWETKEGDKRSTFEIEALTVGPDLRRVTAKAVRAERRSAGWEIAPDPSDPWAVSSPPAGEGEAPTTGEVTAAAESPAETAAA